MEFFCFRRCQFLISLLVVLSLLPYIISYSLNGARVGRKHKFARGCISVYPRRSKSFTPLSAKPDASVDSPEAKLVVESLSSEKSQSAASKSLSDGFGESVPYVPLSQRNQQTPGLDIGGASIPLNNIDEVEIIKQNRLRNIAVAVASFAIAIFNYGWQLTHPVTAVEILATMQSQSAPLASIGNNGKPTVIDFWAPWCENCKFVAPTLQSIEKEYGDRVNFIMVNGDEARNWPLIELFGVDAIPHLALLSGEGDVETALIGPMSRKVLRADIDALLNKKEDCNPVPEVAPVCHDELPFQMFDAFGNRPGGRRINFVRQ